MLEKLHRYIVHYIAKKEIKKIQERALRKRIVNSNKSFMDGMKTYGPKDAFFCNEALKFLTFNLGLSVSVLKEADVRNIADMAHKKINTMLLRESRVL